MDMNQHVEELVAYFGLNLKIRQDLLEAESFSIEHVQKDAPTLIVSGVKPDGSKFLHEVWWTKR